MRIPHGGYHWTGNSHRFFEGWYYRLTLPDAAFAFMYAIDDPTGKTRYSGGSMQVLGVDDQHLWRTLPDCSGFYASGDRLNLSHWQSNGEGYAASDSFNRGRISSPKDDLICTWDYEITPICVATQATMGWLSYLSVFSPGWQILMPHGLAAGHLSWGDRHYRFTHAPVYMEKNWGTAFPSQWFWLQANSFNSAHGHLSLVAAGGKRQTLGISSDVAMVAVYFDGEVYSFMPDRSVIFCEVSPWGSWRITAHDHQNRVEVIGETAAAGTWIMVPTATGLKFSCRDTAQGQIKLNLQTSTFNLFAISDRSALEVGGTPWQTPWRFTSAYL